jgi:glutamate formiminotransferase/formiminotetrahydrofolate cyclodeaminase
LAARSGVLGAFLNVKINAKGIEDKNFVEKIMSEATDIQNKTITLETEILKIVNDKIAK